MIGLREKNWDLSKEHGLFATNPGMAFLLVGMPMQMCVNLHSTRLIAGADMEMTR